MIIFDTTILVYSVGVEHPLRDPCRQAVALAGEGAVRATTTVEVIQEFAHVRAKRRSRSDAATLARSFATGLGPLLVVTEEDLHDGISRFRRSRTLGAFDAVLAAAAVRKGWPLASADRAFRHVKDLVYLDPASPTFLDELKQT